MKNFIRIRETDDCKYVVSFCDSENVVLEYVGEFPKLREAMFAIDEYIQKGLLGIKHKVRFFPHSLCDKIV